MNPLQVRRLLTLLLVVSVLAGVSDTVRCQDSGPVYIEIVADQDRTTPDPLKPFDIRFILHANGNAIQGMSFGLLLQFSNGNSIGTIELWPDGDAPLILSPQSQSTFHSVSVGYGSGVDPDTLLVGLISFSNPWKGTGDLFRLHVTPTDTGTLMLDSNILIPPAHGGLYFYNSLGELVPGVVVTEPIHWPPQPDPVRFRISTSSGTDTLFMGMPGTVYFNVDASGNQIMGMDYCLKWDFTNGSFIGPFSDATGEVNYSPEALAAFNSISYNPGYGQGTSPDFSQLGFSSFGEPFAGSSWIWSVTFNPVDTGTVLIDSILLPPGSVSISALDPLANALPFSLIPGRIVVAPCPYDLMGDVNQSAAITSSDLIYMVNYVFKSGPDPLPDRSVGDVNCSGGLGASDIIYLVNHIFKSGAPPCACIVRRI